jgi:RHS repeat-associated protein
MDGNNAYLYDGGLAPQEQVSLSTGAITYLVADAVGSVRGTVNSSGTLTGTTAYDAWGNPETAGGLTATTPFGYAGGYTDPDGMIYLLNRYYQPSTGQFISVDPKISETLQAYEYGSGDPVLNTDPTGMCGIWCGIVAGIVGTVAAGVCMGILWWPNFCGGVGGGVGNVISYIWGAHPFRWTGALWAFITGFAIGFITMVGAELVFWGLGGALAYFGSWFGREGIENLGYWLEDIGSNIRGDRPGNHEERNLIWYFRRYTHL